MSEAIAVLNAGSSSITTTSRGCSACRASPATCARCSRAASRAAGWLGVELDEPANAAAGPRISTAGSRTAAWVLPTNEELMIARHTRRLLG